MRTTRKGFETIAFYEKTGTNLYGADVGKITLYKQNEVVSEQTNVFSGSGWWGTGENPYKGGFDAASNGNYLMYLNLRNDEGPKKMKSEDSDPEPYFGIQKIPANTTLLRKDGSKYDLNRDYGNSRVRLNPVDDNFVYQANQDRGYYLHGKGAFYNRTHGCVCDKSEKIFNALWELGKNVNGDGKVPFVIGIPYKK